MRKRAKKPSSCFGLWYNRMPDLPNVQGIFHLAATLVRLIILSGIPKAAADISFQSTNPAYPGYAQDFILQCCNGQERQIALALIKQCLIFNTRVLGYTNGYGDFYDEHHYGNTTGGWNSACTLYVASETPIIPSCLSEIILEEVVSGLPDLCSKMLMKLIIITGSIGGALLLVLCGICIREACKSRRNEAPSIEIDTLSQDSEKDEAPTMSLI